MSKFDIKDKLDNALYVAYNCISDFIFHLSYKTKKTVKKNVVYKDKHKGERCFVLGTGPSLSALTGDQINALKNEIVFGTNSLYKAEITSEINPAYYALLDNLYWEQWSYTFDEVAQKYSGKSPVFLTDFRARHLAQKALPLNQHIYIYSKKYPTIKMSEKIDTNIFAAMNVVSYAILSAMYMGFKKIYLLGCDYNAFCTAGHGHAYDDKSELKQVDYNLAFYLKFYWITTEFHYLIQGLARKNGVEIINLTRGSLLDAYVKKSAEEVLG